MITYERLKELIEQEATIWAVYDEDRIERIKLVVRMFGVSVEEYNKLHDCEPMLYSQFCGVFRDICPISWLFETEEEAEWHKEFGCIERTERLELPTWEEFSKWDKLVKFYKNKTYYSMYVFIKNKNTNNCRIIIYADNGEQDWLVFEKPLTKENYTLACRKAKELFLGEVDERD